jgi:hypothetical protein
METSDPLLAELARWLKALDAPTASRLGELLVALGRLLRRHLTQFPDAVIQTTATGPAGQESATSAAPSSSPPNGSEATTPPTSPPQPPDSFYVEWLIHAKHDARFMTSEQTNQLLLQSYFDLVINEPALEWRCHQGRLVRKKHLDDLHRRPGELIWLAFTHVGQILRKADMAYYFGGSKSNPASQDNLVHVSKCRLKQALPPALCIRIFGRKGSRDGYRIRHYGWSYCWIRREEDPKSSVLIRDWVISQSQKREG